MKCLLFCAFLVLYFLSDGTYAQETKNKEYFVSLEIGGVGGVASLNYEWKLAQKNNTRFYFRNGFTFAPIDKNNGTAFVFPLMIHAVVGSGKHKFDFGIGQGISITTKGHFFVLMPTSFGYRLQNPEKKHYWRFAYTPLISYLVDFQVQHWGGITFGIEL